MEDHSVARWGTLALISGMVVGRLLSTQWIQLSLIHIVVGGFAIGLGLLLIREFVIRRGHGRHRIRNRKPHQSQMMR